MDIDEAEKTMETECNEFQTIPHFQTFKDGKRIDMYSDDDEKLLKESIDKLEKL